VPFHLLRLLDSINVEDGWSDVVDAGLETHQALVAFDAWSHGEEGAGNIVAIREVVLSDDGSGFLVVHVRVRIGVLKLAQRLNAMVRNDKDICVLVDVLQNAAQNLTARAT